MFYRFVGILWVDTGDLSKKVHRNVCFDFKDDQSLDLINLRLISLI